MLKNNLLKESILMLMMIKALSFFLKQKMYLKCYNKEK
jgi:hypothetical protein